MAAPDAVPQDQAAVMHDGLRVAHHAVPGAMRRRMLRLLAGSIRLERVLSENRRGQGQDKTQRQPGARASWLGEWGSPRSPERMGERAKKRSTRRVHSRNSTHHRANQSFENTSTSRRRRFSDEATLREKQESSALWKMPRRTAYYIIY
jgi:hypothetical protein